MISHTKLKPKRDYYRLSPQKAKEIQKMFALGKTPYRISEDLGISFQTVKKYTDPQYRKKVNEYNRVYYLKQYDN